MVVVLLLFLLLQCCQHISCVPSSGFHIGDKGKTYMASYILGPLDKYLEDWMCYCGGLEQFVGANGTK